MPKLSPTMEEGQLARWLKKEGDTVSMGEPLAEIDTDKATMEMQALGNGVLRKILIKEGETAPLGDVIAIIGEADEDISALVGGAASGAPSAGDKQDTKGQDEGGDGAQPEAAQAPAGGANAQATVPSQQPQAGATPETGGGGNTPPSGNGAAAAAPGDGQGRGDGRMIVSPLAARMAAEAGINLRTLAGSGPGGRIVKRDIEQAIAVAQQQPQPAPAQLQQPAAQPQPQPSAAPEAPTQRQPAPAQPQAAGTSAVPYRDEPLSTMRQTIARRLVTSIGPVPHFFLTTEIEMDKTAELRRSLNALDEKLKVSVNDIIVKAVATSLMEHPAVNASFQDKAIRYYERADVGVAVAIEDGLITPVVRGANQKSVGAISREVRELAERARARKLAPEEYTGATFSVSNLGMLGIDDFTAVINPPEAAILAVGAVTAKPVVRDGEVVVRQMMRVTMSCDHRVIDGATGARFLQTFKRILENPLYLIA